MNPRSPAQCAAPRRPRGCALRKFGDVTKALRFWSAFARVWITAAIFWFASSGFAQQALYPLKEGILQPFHSNDVPSWMTLDMELRGRTEEQTSLGYVSGKDRLYELTRVWGGMTVVPTNWLTFYAQFMDLHALGLPLRDTAANMRDTFDLRQGYLDFHYKPVQFIVGRRELRIGDERVVGISDWTNTSRTWDGFYVRVGNVNQLNLFSTSVVTVHPTSLDTHGAGLTFHGVHAKLATYVPHTTIEPFVLIRALPRVTSQQGVVGTETEVTFGSYYETKLPLGFDSSGTGDLQRGSYSNDSIHAGAAIVRGGYGAKRLPWQPHLEAEYDYATGNPHTESRSHRHLRSAVSEQPQCVRPGRLVRLPEHQAASPEPAVDAAQRPAGALSGRIAARGDDPRWHLLRRRRKL